MRWGGRRDGRPALLLAGLVLGIICVATLNTLQGSAKARKHDEKLYYPSGRFLREAACGYREVVADYLWFQAIQYYGAFRKGENDLRYFRGLIDCVTQLDPRFIEAYFFGSLVQVMDEGDLPAGIDLVKQGILDNPDTWVLPFHIGFFFYALSRDYDRAGLWFEVASQQPDATDFARRFAAFARKKAGNLEGSLVLWQNLHRTTKDPGMKKLAERMIQDCREKMSAGAARSGGVQ